ncbi:MAG: homoserine kinase [Planctomycetes bacterium]|nr:homoserine kinase [Planctomycetota bacterium]
MAFSRKQQRALRLQVPASTSNVGPGFDCFSIAVDHFVDLRWKPGERLEIERKGALTESTLTPGRDPVLRGMRRAAALAGGKLPPGKITVESAFPPGRGLGASGAGLVGGLLLGNRLTGSKIKSENLLSEAIALEGHPENAAASMLGGAHWSVPRAKGDWIHHPVQLHKELRFLVVIPPYPLATSRAREVLPTSVSLQRAVDQARRTPLLVEGLRTLNPELIRIGIQDEIHVAPRLKLLTGAKSVLEFAEQVGAIAATLSGAGSALLILTRTGELRTLETKLQRRVKRLWGESGMVLNARVTTKAAAFV